MITHGPSDSATSLVEKRWRRHIQGSGKNGTLIAKDLAEMVKEMEEEEGSETM